MTHFKLALLFFGIWSLYSCKDRKFHEEIANPQLKHIAVSLSENDTINLSDLYSKKQTIKLNNSLSIGEITSVRTCDDYIFLTTDSKRASLLILDRQGKLIAKLPDTDLFKKEYFASLQYVDIDCENKQLEIFDRAARQIVIFDFLGNFKERFAINLWATSFEKLNQNKYIINTGNEINGNIREKLVIFDRSEGKASDSYLKANTAKSNLLLNDLISFTNIRDSIFYLSAFSDTVYFFNKKSNEITPNYLLDCGKDHLPPNISNRGYRHIADYLTQIREMPYAFFLSGWYDFNNVILTSIEKSGTRYHVEINKNTLTSRTISHYIDDIFFDKAIIPASFGYLPKWVNYSMNEAYFVKYPAEFVGKFESQISAEFTDNPILLIYNIK